MLQPEAPGFRKQPSAQSASQPRKRSPLPWQPVSHPKPLKLLPEACRQLHSYQHCRPLSAPQHCWRRLQSSFSGFQRLRRLCGNLQRSRRRRLFCLLWFPEPLRRVQRSFSRVSSVLLGRRCWVEEGWLAASQVWVIFGVPFSKCFRYQGMLVPL